jgi:hypothetical protein
MRGRLCSPRTVLAGTVAVLAVTGTALVGHHSSRDAVLLGWSARYTAFVLAPLGAGVVQCVVLLAPAYWTTRSAPSRRAVLALGLVCLACAAASYAAPTAHARWTLLLLGMTGGLLLLALVLRPEWLLTMGAVALAGSLFLLFELPAVAETRRSDPRLLVSWGTVATHRYLFPQKPPFIGPGGRLRPGVRLRVQGPPWVLRQGFEFRTNDLGFRNDRRAGQAACGVDADCLLSLGDSFANGYGVDQRRFFAPKLEALLSATGSRRWTVWSAEVSDPAYGLYYVRHHASAHRPAIITYGLFANDLFQSFMATEVRRTFAFTPTGDFVPTGENRKADVPAEWDQYRYRAVAEPPRPRTRTRPLPYAMEELLQARLLGFIRQVLFDQAAYREEALVAMVERLGASDGRLRLLVSENPIGLYSVGPIAPLAAMYARTFECLEAMARAVEGGNARFVLVYLPQRFEVQPRDWNAVVTRWRLAPTDFDVDTPRRHVGAFARGAGIAFCDLTPDLREAAREHDVYFSDDNHLNERGHRVAAASVATCLSGRRAAVAVDRGGKRVSAVVGARRRSGALAGSGRRALGGRAVTTFRRVMAEHRGGIWARLAEERLRELSVPVDPVGAR